MDWQYTRKSRALGDPDDPELLAHHLSALQRLVAADGASIPPERILTEVGSGETIADRPVFSGLLGALERLPANVGGTIYCLELERLSRGSMAERGRIADALARANIKIRTPARIYDLRNADDLFLFSILSSAGQHELGKYKERQARKFAEMTRAGKICSGEVPFGYLRDTERKTLRPDPVKFPILREWCQLIPTVSVVRLAARYGVPKTTVANTLRNPVIAGWAPRRYGRRPGLRSERITSRRLPPEEWLWPEQEGDWESAITLAEWRAIQAVMDAREDRRLKTRAENGWCRDRLEFEGAAGCHVNLSSYQPMEGGVRTHVPTYDVRRPGQVRLYVPRVLVHEAALEEMRRLLSDRQRVADALAWYQQHAALEAEIADTAEEAEKARRQLERQRGTLVNLALSLADPDLPPERRHATEQAQEQCDQEISRLRGRLEQLRSATVAVAAVDHLIETFPEAFTDWEVLWGEMTEGEKRATVNAVFSRIVVRITGRGQGRPFTREVVLIEPLAWLQCVG